MWSCSFVLKPADPSIILSNGTSSAGNRGTVAELINTDGLTLTNFRDLLIGSRPCMKMPLSVRHEGPLNGLNTMKIIWLIYFSVRSQQISTQLNTYGRLSTNVSMTHSSPWPPQLLESMQRRIEAFLAACGSPTPYWDTLFIPHLRLLNSAANTGRVLNRSRPDLQPLNYSTFANQKSWHISVQVPKGLTVLQFRQSSS